jgi:hypothetical protein
MHDKVNHVVKQTLLEASRKAESKILSELFDSSNDAILSLGCLKQGEEAR